MIKTTLIIFSLSALAMYLQRARIHYRRTVAAAAAHYGPRTAKRTRIKFAIRAMLWAVPYKIYHWKQILWDRRSEELLEKGEEE